MIPGSVYFSNIWTSPVFYFKFNYINFVIFISFFTSYAMVFILILMLQSQSLNDQEAISRNCKTDVTWSFDSETKKLTISGSGQMTEYSNKNDVPWASNANYISTITIEEGITSIGNFSFSGFMNLETINIPEGVTYIGNYAVAQCVILKNIIIPRSRKLDRIII